MAAGGGKEMEIAIKIAGKVESSFKSAIGAAKKGLASIPKGIGNVAKTVGAATAAAAAAVGAMGVAAVKTGMEFESAMSQVAATMLIDKTTEEGQKAFETLENAAMECGASTAFSATEAAEALNYLALAGYDADKAATALPTVLKLAGAGAMELAAASDMVTDSMSALGIEATEENLTGFSDQLAKTASKSNTSVAQLGEAILTVGGTAKGLAGGTTELNTALGILADNGIKASEGGTHLRNMILSLQNPRNSDAADLFENLGISAYDAQGNMRSLGDVFGDLNNVMAGMTAEDVNRTLAMMFKQTDLASARAMLVATADSVESLGTAVDASLAESGTSLSALGIDLQELAAGFDAASTQEQFSEEMLKRYNLTSEQAATLFTGLQSVVGGTGNRFEELSAQIEDSAGACEDMYAIQLDNLEGDITILKSGISNLGIKISKDLNGPLREMTQLATGMVEELSKAYKSGGMEGMVGAVGGCMSEAVNVVADYAPQVVSMGISLLENFIGGITDNSGAVADAAADVITVFIEGIFTLVPQVILAGIDIITQFAQSMIQQLPQLISSGTQAIENFANGIIQRLPVIISTALMLVQTLVNSIGQNAPMLISSAIQLVGNLAIGIISMLPQLLQMGIQLILSLVQGIIANIPLILQMGSRVVVGLISGLSQMVPMLWQGGVQLIMMLIQGIISNLGNIIQAGVEMILALITGMIRAIPQIIASIGQLIIMILNTIFETDWLKVGMDILTGIKDGILNMAAGLGSAVKDTVLGLFGLGGGSDDEKAAESGASTASSYANGITQNAGLATDAADGLSSAAFGAMDLSGATAAGTQAGSAFSAGLSGSMASGGIDAASFSLNMTNMGTTGAEALNTGLNTGIAGTTIDTSSILDMSSFGEDMTAAGTDGATAISTGMAENSQAVTQAATAFGNDVNTALDGGWNKAKMNAQTAMQQISATVTSAARSAASTVKAAFENMTITIPRPKIPVINVTEDPFSFGEGGKVNVPRFSVNWNAVGGILDKPVIFSTSQGMQGAGEAGPEAILPLDTLWAKMKEILDGAIAVSAAGGGASLIDAFVEKLKGIGGGGRRQQELAGAGGPAVQYSPVYNIYGSAGKSEIVEAGRMSQAEFSRMMKQYERDRRRRNL